MNYIDITQPSQTLKLNLNISEVNEVEVEVFKDGSDTSIDVFYIYEVLNFKYYQQIEVPTTTIDLLKDETQYNIVVTETDNFKVVYRGKMQTTSKDLSNLSINENKYTQKTNATNYTILD